MATLGQYNLEEMTKQEVFEATCIHLLEQSEQSLDDVMGIDCLYNGDGGLCCAAGIFVQNYDEIMENNSWSDLVVAFSQSNKYELLIDDLQSLHDNSIAPEWLSRMKEVSKYYDLDTSFLEPWQWDEETCKYIKNES